MLTKEIFIGLGKTSPNKGKLMHYALVIIKLFALLPQGL